MTLDDLKGKTIKRIEIGLGTEIEIDFTDGTKIDLEISNYPDGTIRSISVYKRS